VQLGIYKANMRGTLPHWATVFCHRVTQSQCRWSQGVSVGTPRGYWQWTRQSGVVCWTRREHHHQSVMSSSSAHLASSSRTSARLQLMLYIFSIHLHTYYKHTTSYQQPQMYALSGFVAPTSSRDDNHHQPTKSTNKTVAIKHP